MKIGDKMMSVGQTCEIIAIECDASFGVAGRYTVRFTDGRVIFNYPGYLLKEQVPEDTP